MDELILILGICLGGIGYAGAMIVFYFDSLESKLTTFSYKWYYVLAGILLLSAVLLGYYSFRVR